NSELQFLPTSEGFYDYIKNQYIYQYKDHLGNTRVSFGKNSAGVLEIVDVNDYYPFGMNHLKSGNSFFGVSSYKNYKYNGKELQETGMYDYGARFYMADIGRWGVQDLLSEFYYSYSPYNYVGNNPIIRTDPTGADWYTDKDGNYQYNSNLNKDNADKFFKDNKIEGAKYFAASGKAISGYNLGKDNQEITSSYNLNSDGSVTDNILGKNIDAGSTGQLGETGKSVTAVDDRPTGDLNKNGDKFYSNDKNTYQLNNNHWVKLSGQMVDANALHAGGMGSIYSTHNSITLVDRAIYNDNLTTIFDYTIDLKGLAVGMGLSSIEKGKFEKPSIKGLVIGFIYNFYSGTFNQLNSIREHDENAEKNINQNKK
ncbi:RHS repeat-associated core domain-containing protein, partial [Chryseobacterium gambrini]